jgi:UDP-N-acetylglucosamine 4,6-dehydratase
VPSCEFFLIEAICTNGLGAENVMNAATACQTKNVIVLSMESSISH